MINYELIISELQRSSPVEIIFGRNSLNKLKPIINSIGSKCLVVTGPNISKTLNFKNLLDILNFSNCKFDVYRNVSTEPTVNHVYEITELFHKLESDFIIGFGGGSALDAAKAASVLIYNDHDLEDLMMGEKKINETSAPLILIPTTSGTGSELSKGSILSVPERKIKGGLRGDQLYANYAIIDSKLTSSAPTNVIRVSGFDVFTHAVETFISKVSTALTERLSLIAIEYVVSSLPKILTNPNDDEARERLAFSSMLMGFNLANSSTCLPHRLQYPLGELTKSPHAVGLAAIYPSWIKITSNKSKRKFNIIAETILSGFSQAEINYTCEKNVASIISYFMHIIGMEIKLTDLGVSKEDCFAMEAKVSGSLENDPWWTPESNLSSIYLDSL